MNEIKPNMLAWVKTTGEVVFVLNVTPLETGDDPEGKLLAKDTFCGYKAHCRVPIAGENGISHTIATFVLEELETMQQRLQREKDAYAALADPEMAKLKPVALPIKIVDGDGGNNVH